MPRQQRRYTRLQWLWVLHERDADGVAAQDAAQALLRDARAEARGCVGPVQRLTPVAESLQAPQRRRLAHRRPRQRGGGRGGPGACAEACMTSRSIVSVSEFHTQRC